MPFLTKLIADQLFRTPEIPPSTSFASQTVIVTGSNVGLGLEAAKHIVRLDAAKVILAVRTTSKGEAAKRDIEAATGSKGGVVEVWPLDLSSYASVKQFAAKAQGLDRVDVLLENAGISTNKFITTEDNESTITTNVVSTYLLGLLMLPKLRETAARYGTKPRLVFVASEVHYMSKFKFEGKGGGIFERLNDEKSADMIDRYNTSKLLDVLCTRELSAQTKAKGHTDVIINCLNPGFCYSELGGDMTGAMKVGLKVGRALLARTTEVGGRTLVASAAAGEETHGAYMNNCKVEEPSPFVTSSEGAKAQKKLWEELNQKLEKIQPGIMANV